MKNNYRTIKAAIGLFSLMSINAGAQALSGAYTINSASATAGTNYQTFTAFASALNTGTVTGAITVNVATGSGPYNEQITFNQANGVSATKMITINGNGNTLAFNSTNFAAPWTMLLNGADYMTFNNLNVDGQGPTYAMSVVLTGAANYNSFNNGLFSCPVNGTSTYQCPFSLTSSNSFPTSTGTDSGNYNTVTSCTMTNGYYGFTFCGLTGTPWQVGNKLVNSLITDFYNYGAYFYYPKDGLLKNTTIQRPTRTASGSVYSIYGYYSQNMTYEGNKVWKVFENMLNASSITYGMYIYYNPVTNNVLRNTVRNNIVTGLKNNSTAYGIYAINSNSDIYNNTFDMDNTNSTAGTVYGVYAYATTGYTNNITNNIISIQRGASTGTKYGLYLNGIGGGLTSDRNDIYMNNSAGTNYYGNYTSAAATFTAYQQQGVEATSFSLNPQFANQAAYDLHPTNPAIDNQAIPMGLVNDQQGAYRSQTTPDLGALEFLTPNCSGLPALTSVVSPTYLVCPGSTSEIHLTNIQTDLGITFQWQVATQSAFGPFTNIPGATAPSYTTNPATGNLYYSAVITCANGNGSVQATAGQIVVAGTTVGNIPYNEGFESTAFNGQLPNCSWSIPNGTTSVQTYSSGTTGYRFPATGSKFAAFSGTATGTNYAYTNGLNLYPGITYTASMKYLTDNTGNFNWSSLAMSIGTAQASAGLSPIVSLSGNSIIAPQYVTIGGTFTVATAGVYYLAISAAALPGTTSYLSFDDLSITIPCSLNSPSLAVAGPSTACSGQPINLSATGANTYMWTLANSTFTSSNGGVTNTPNQPGVASYMVVGTNTLTGCSVSLIKNVNIVAGPLVSIYIADPNNGVCPDEVAVLHAVGNASGYLWSTGQAGATATIAPTANTVYSVTGSNATNCTSTATISVVLKEQPNVSGASSHSVICKGESITLSATGADQYSWFSNGTILMGDVVMASPVIPTNYQLVGKSLATNCTNTVVVTVNVQICAGISSLSADNTAVNVYPNPTNGLITLDLNSTAVKTINVTDLSGRVLMSSTTSDSSVEFNMGNLSNGVYFVKVQSNEKVSVIKVVKQ